MSWLHKNSLKHIKNTTLVKMQSDLHLILSKNCLQQQLRNSMHAYRLFLSIQFSLGDAYLKSSKDFIN